MRVLLTSFALCLLLLSVHIQAKAPTSLPDLSYGDQQSETAIEVVYRLYAKHFNKRKLDDELSQAFLEQYLDSLDPNKMHFYAEDIKGFQSHAKKFDDDFRAGKLDMVYAIYKVYQKRADQRLEQAVALLKDTEVSFDFSKDESIQLEREDAEWLADEAEADRLWFKRIKLGVLNLKLAGKDVDEARTTLGKRFQGQLNRLRQETSNDVLEVALNSLTTLYDPHTNYWLPRTSENFNINMSKSLEGIGAVLQVEDELTKVVRLVPGGPAAKAGQLKAADRILAVGQGLKGELVDVVGWRLSEVVDLIRGPKDTHVKLEILPAGEATGSPTQVIDIKRGRVKLEDQEAKKAILELPGQNKGDIYKLGVIQLPDFYVDFEAYNKRDPNFKSSSKDVRKLVEELMQENVQGIVLDLRNNGGGSLDEARELTDIFIDRGVVVQIKSPKGWIGRRHQAHQKALYAGPLVVLVNRLSASASEIFAGAIQDYGRGLIIGSRSFGKGTVQSVNRLNYGQLKLTESKFYRVSGDSTQHRGVVPDIKFPSLIDEEVVGESAYDHALLWDQIRSAPHAVYSDYSSIIPTLTERHSERAANDPDFIFLKERIRLGEENEADSLISLNEKKRNERKVSIEKQALDIENARRAAKGLELYKTVKEFEESEAEKDEAAVVNEIDVVGDTLLIESGNIMVDFIELSKQSQQRQKLVKQ